MANIGDIIDGKYEIIERIGGGGMSNVYLAIDKSLSLDKKWVVKEIKTNCSEKEEKKYSDSLIREAHLMKELSHYAIPRIVSILENDSTVCIVMDYIDGKNLSEEIKDEGPLSEELVLKLSKQLCEALKYLHSLTPPIIHRDMKPANVILTPENNAVILDFGIARRMYPDAPKDTSRTKKYSPPEQEKGYTDQRSDIYSLGMTMYELLTGDVPKDRKKPAPVRSRNPLVSEGLEAIIKKCIKYDAKDRYQSCDELLKDLDDPDKLTKKYIQIKKRKVIATFTALALSVVMLISGILCGVFAKKVNNNTYESLVSVVEATPYDEKIDSYKKAIEIYPGQPEAYIKMLEAYEAESRFSKQENDEFLALYNTGKDYFDNTSVEVARLNYKTGMMYFNYYTNEDGTVSFSNRVQKAYPFFEANYSNTELPETFTEKTVSDCYYRICSFYREYIFNSTTVKEASNSDYSSLLETIYGALNDVKGAGAYDQLTLYNGTFMLLYDQRAGMASVNMDKNEVLNLLKTVYDSAKNLNVNKELSKKLQQEIVEKYDQYREAIERVFTNYEERG